MTNNQYKSDQLQPSRQMPDKDSQLEYQSRPEFADWNPPGSYGGYGAVEEQVNLRDLWRKIFKHKWLIFSVVTIVTTVVTIAAYGIKPWYKATTVIEVGKENAMNLKSGDVVLNDDTDPNYLVNINTKKLALSSYELFEEVVVDQKLDQNPAVIEAVNKKPLLAFFSSNNSAEKQSAQPNAKINNPAPVPGKNTKPKNEPAKNETAKSEPPPVSEASAKLAPFVEYLRDRLDVDHVIETRALQVSFTNEDPELAANVTNSVAKIFMQRSFNSQTERFNNSADWLDTSTRQLKTKVEAAETALADYTREKQIYSTGIGDDDVKNPTLTTSRLTQLHDQYIRAQTERMLKQSLYDQLKEGRISELPEIFSDPKIVEAEKQLNLLVTQSAELKARFGPENPKIIEIQNQIEALTTQIDASQKALENKIKADYDRSVKDENSLLAALDKAKVEAVDENQASIKLNILQQDVNTARALYTDFLQKTNQAKTQVAEQNNSIKIIQTAQVPLKPVGPKRMILILTGFFLSLGFGVGLAFLIEYLDHTVKSVEDVEAFAQLPVLGLIPKSSTLARTAARSMFGRGREKQLSLRSENETSGESEPNQAQLGLLHSLENHSLVGEAYRTLRTSILMSFAGSPPKTILITSGQAGDGKTTTAVNTAISLTQLGAKVLIIDCDLRRPSVHQKLGIAPERGLSTYLSSSVGLDELIQTTDIPNLSVLPCGYTPPNPAELISSNKMVEMLKELAEKYDHVVIDSPPLINVTDSVILSGLVDGTIMVVNSGRTIREVLQRCRQELLNVRSKILGVVLNNVTLERDENYQYYRYSDYDSANV